ncbi:hypothetical protein PIB30_051168 [Stylosanthes scabra]|uniref:NADP-dependent oxidoreductase domain-containing protein n=1 Tax=Stylosanthes scabra TaxID=79078 RepID=A0ABU6UJS0_9FABA|nr:hypothetical protein [Stylosanthes scabra]
MALQLGILNRREEAFITSKLWCNNAHHDLVLPALNTTLKKLGLDYVDLYLIHMPVRLKPEVDGVLEIRKEDLIPFDIKGTWEAMEECQRLGLAKSIGVSNFGIKKLNQLLENATIPPAVNQVEMSPSWQQEKLREFCKQKGIHVAAWSPLGAYTKAWGTNAVMESPIIHEIATARSKSAAQVALKWIVEQGAIPIVKSFNKERMGENLEIFQWELTHEESQKFSQIAQQRMFNGEIFISENGPYKSLEEFWDGDP